MLQRTSTILLSTPQKAEKIRAIEALRGKSLNTGQRIFLSHLMALPDSGRAIRLLMQIPDNDFGHILERIGHFQMTSRRTTG